MCRKWHGKVAIEVQWSTFPANIRRRSLMSRVNFAAMASPSSKISSTATTRSYSSMASPTVQLESWKKIGTRIKVSQAVPAVKCHYPYIDMRACPTFLVPTSVVTKTLKSVLNLHECAQTRVERNSCHQPNRSQQLNFSLGAFTPHPSGPQAKKTIGRRP